MANLVTAVDRRRWLTLAPATRRLLPGRQFGEKLGRPRAGKRIYRAGLRDLFEQRPQQPGSFGFAVSLPGLMMAPC